MEVEAPFSYTEAGGRAHALLRMCDRWTNRYFFKMPVLLLDPKQPPADILSDANHEKSPVDITNDWGERYYVNLDGMDGCITSEEFKFTAMPSSEGGLDNYNVSQILRQKDESAFRCQKSMLPEGELGMDKKSLNSSAITEQAPEVYARRDALGVGGDSFLQDSGQFFSVTADADNQHGNGRNVARNQIFKRSKTCSGGSRSKPDDDIDNIQQQQQQHVDSFGTGVHLLTHSVVNEDCLRASPWGTRFAAMNWMNIPGSMNFNNNSGCKTVSGMDMNQQRSLEDTDQTTQRTNGAPVINSTEHKGEPELHRNRIWAIAYFLSIFGSSVIMAQQGSISPPLKNTPAAAPLTTPWIVASAAPHHATGNRALLSDFAPEHSAIFLIGGEAGAMPMQVAGRGAVVTETMLLPDVWYVPGLAANLVSVSQLAELDYSVAFGRGKCYVRSAAGDGAIVGAARAGEDGLFALDFLRVPLGL